MIIVILLLAAFAIWKAYVLFYAANAYEGIYAEISYDNKTPEKVYLDENRVFSIEGLPNVVFEVRDSKISFIESDCPDKVCVHTGWLDRGGHFAACLPNRVIVRIFDEEGSEVDAVAR